MISRRSCIWIVLLAIGLIALFYGVQTYYQPSPIKCVVRASNTTHQSTSPINQHKPTSTININHQHHPSTSTSPTDNLLAELVSIPPDCPFWLSDYVKFHQHTKGTAGAKYLILYSGVRETFNGGVSDRLRAILYWAELCHRYKRVLLIFWVDHDLTSYLRPNLIDWTTNDSFVNAAIRVNAPLNGMWPVPFPNFFQTLNSVDTVAIVVHSNLEHSVDGIHQIHCVYRTFFRPSEAVLNGVLEQLTSAGFTRYNSPNRFTPQESDDLYQKHLVIAGRFGDTHFCEGALASEQDLIAARKAIHCSKQVQSHFFPNSNTRNVLFIADSSSVKEALKSWTGIFVSTTVPVHSDEHAASLLAVFIDLYLIASAACLVRVSENGGFPKFARYFSRRPCTYSFSECNRLAECYD